MVSSEHHLNFVLAKMVHWPQQNLNLSLQLYQCRFETCRWQRFLFIGTRRPLRFIHGWFPRIRSLSWLVLARWFLQQNENLCHLDAQVQNVPMTSVFLLEHTSTFSYGWIRRTFILISLSHLEWWLQQSQNLFHLGHAGSKPADTEWFLSYQDIP